MITLENFSETNRSRTIGNSLYRICKADKGGKWYIHEVYNNGAEWAGNNAYRNEDLQEVINILNSFTKEKEIVSLMP